jgi:hypothetical protein
MKKYKKSKKGNHRKLSQKMMKTAKIINITKMKDVVLFAACNSNKTQSTKML